MSKVSKADKLKMLQGVMADVQKKHGKSSVMLMGNGVIERVPSISTGSLKLNRAIGIGGVPQGRIIEIYGPESSGKTTVTLHMIAEAQKAGGICMFVDAEHALDPIYARAIGVNMDELILSQPDCGEQALEIVDEFTRSGAVDLIIVDSVAALTPRAEIEGEMGDSHMGLQARLMSQALRKLTGTVKKTNTTVCFINQLRMKIGVMFGNPETTTGGNALKFYASVRMDVRKFNTNKDSKGNMTSNDVRIKIIKNKVAPPFKQAEIKIVFGKGIDIDEEYLDFAIEFDIINQAGAWFSYKGEKYQGRANLVKFLSENPQEKEAIEKAVLKELEKEYSGDEEVVLNESPNKE